jgi:hypothetical protein
VYSMTAGFLKILAIAAYGVFAILIAAGLVSDMQYLMEWEGMNGPYAFFLALAGVVMAGVYGDVPTRLCRSVDRYVARLQRAQARAEPIYEPTQDLGYLKGENRPLPASLRYRVALYMGARQTTDPGRFKEQLAAAPSVNAFLRREIHAGRI